MANDFLLELMAYGHGPGAFKEFDFGKHVYNEAVPVMALKSNRITEITSP